MPFNWKNSPDLPSPIQPIVIPPTAVTYKVDQVANTVNWGGTLLYNTAPAVYDVIYPSNGSNVFIDTSNFATIEYVNSAIANVNTGGAGIGNVFVTFYPTNRYVTGQANVVADSNNDILTLRGGKGILVTSNASNDMLQIHGLASAAIHPSYNSLLQATNTWFTTSFPLGSTLGGGVDIIWIDTLQQFVASRYQGTTTLIMTSRDGDNWTVKQTPTVSTYKRGGNICYSPELGLIITLLEDTVISQQPQALISVDANTWTLINVAGNSSNQVWRDITWSPELGMFAAVSYPLAGSVTAAHNTYHVMTSTDGYVWTLRDTGANNRQFGGIAWSGSVGRFVAVGRRGYVTPANADNTSVIYSSDGINWSKVTTPTITTHDIITPFYRISPSYWHDVVWASGIGKYVAVGGVVDAKVNVWDNLHTWATSTDGINWSVVNNYYAEYRDHKPLQAGIMYSSATGVLLTYPGRLGDATGVVIAHNTSGGNTNSYSFTTSTDATTWTRVREPLPQYSFNHWKGMAYSPTLGKYVGVSSRLEWYGSGSRTDILTSTTAAEGTWSASFMKRDGYTLTGSVWNAERGEYVIVSDTTATNTTPSPVIISRKSRDGKNWSEPYISSQYSEHSLRWYGGPVWSPEQQKYVIVGDVALTVSNPTSPYSSSLAATSPDGITWTLRTTPTGQYYGFYSVIWASEINLFVATNMYGGLIGNQVMTSPDGITWTIRSTPTQAYDFFWWYAQAWSPELGLLVAVAQEDSETKGVMTSPDGITWTARATPGLAWWSGVAWSPELRLFAATCANTNFYYSVATSPDGITWTNANVAPELAYAVGIAWSHEYQAFVAHGGEKVLVSRDGVTWHSANTGLTGTIATYADILTWSPDRGQFLDVTHLGDIRRSNVSGIWRTIETSITNANLQTQFMGILPVSKGGTGKSLATANGQVLIGNTVSGGFDLRQLTAGSGVTITNGKGTITISSTGGPGSSGNSFTTINVAGQNNVVADSNTDTLYIAPGNGIGITTNSISDLITIFAATNNTAPINYDALTATISHADSGVVATTYGNATHVATVTVDAKGHITSVANTLIAVGAGSNSFGVINVAGQSDVVSDQANDTLVLVAGYGVTITTDAPNDTITLSATDPFARDTANGAFAHANGAFDKANAANVLAQTARDHANGAFTKANTNSPNTAAAGVIQFNNGTAFGGAANLVWDNANNRLGIRTPEPLTDIWGDPTYFAPLQVRGDGIFYSVGNDSNGPDFTFLKSRGASVNSHQILQLGDELFYMSAFGDNANVANQNYWAESVAISGVVDQVPTANLPVPGALKFSTNPGTLSGGWPSLERMRITSNGHVGIGTTTPSDELVVEADGPTKGYVGLQLTHYSGAGATPADVEFFGQAARGTKASPSAIKMDDILFAFGGAGHTGSAFTTNRVWCAFYASEDWTVANNGTKIELATTANNTTTPITRLFIKENGFVGIGNTSPAHRFSVSGNAFIGSTLTLRSGIQDATGTVGNPGSLLSSNGSAAVWKSATANGQVLIGNTVSGGFDVNTLTAGPNIIITNDKGSITIEASSGSSTDQFARDRANGAFDKANAANVLAQTARDHANGSFTTANIAYHHANLEFGFIYSDTTNPGVYTDWTALHAAYVTAGSPNTTIGFWQSVANDTNSVMLSIPSGYWPFANGTKWKAVRDSVAGARTAQIRFESGSRISGVQTFESVQLFSNTSVAMYLDGTTVSGVAQSPSYIYLLNGTTTTGNNVNTFVFYANTDSCGMSISGWWTTLNQYSVDIPGANNFYCDTVEINTINPNAIRATNAGSAVWFGRYDHGTSIISTQSLVAGTVQAYDILRETIGTTAARPVYPGNGQMYFDTTLAVPIWWNNGWGRFVTANIPESTTNLYFTAERVRANISNTYPVYYNSSTGVVSFVPATANGQVLIGNTVSGSFDVATLTQGTGIVITNDKGSITIAATGGSATDQFARDTANGAYAHANGAFNKANTNSPNTAATGVIQFYNGTGFGGDPALYWDDANSFMRVGSVSRNATALSVNTSPFLNNWGTYYALYVQGDLGVVRWGNNAGGDGPDQSFARSRGTTPGVHVIVQNNDELGGLSFTGSNGTNFDLDPAGMQVHVDGVATVNAIPGRITFRTAPSEGAGGDGYAVERLRISSNGDIGIGTSTPTYGGATYTYVSIGQTKSGIIDFRHGGVSKGWVWASPSANALQVQGNTDLDLSASTPGNVYISSPGYTGVYTGASLLERMRVTPNGNVCIGYSSDIGVGSTVGSRYVAINGSADSFTAYMSNNIVRGYAGAFDGHVYLSYANTESVGLYGSSILLHSGAQGATPNVVVTTAGLVGIANTAPNHLLTVQGNVWAYSTTANLHWDSSSGRLGIGAGATPNALFHANSTAATTVIPQIIAEANTYAAIQLRNRVPLRQFELGQDNFATYFWNSNSNQMWFATNNQERFVITETGKIGLGNNAPGHNCTVSGSSWFNGAFYANNSPGNAGQYLTSNGNNIRWSTLIHTKSLAVFTPNTSDNITCFWTSNTINFRQCVSVVQGTNPNVTYRLSYSNTRASGTVGTAITGDIVCANTTNGVFTTTFTNAQVPADNYVFLQFPSVANTVNEFALTMEYTI